MCSHEVVKPGSCLRKAACRFSHDRAVVAKDRKDKVKHTAHKGRVTAYNARVAAVAVPDSTAEEGEDEQRAACSATRTPAPTTGLAAGSRFVISFSDSDDDAPASRAASSAYRQSPPSSDDDDSSLDAWGEHLDTDDDASDHTTVVSGSCGTQRTGTYTTVEDASNTEPDSGNSSDTQPDNRYDVDTVRHGGPSDTYSRPPAKELFYRPALVVSGNTLRLGSAMIPR